MEYQGADIYKFYLDDREIELSKYDIEKIVAEYNECNSHDYEEKNLLNIIKPRKFRKYNKSSSIKSLFKKYYDETKTKKEVFTQISLELEISYKAVEKAYYSK